MATNKLISLVTATLHRVVVSVPSPVIPVAIIVPSVAVVFSVATATIVAERSWAVTVLFGRSAAWIASVSVTDEPWLAIASVAIVFPVGRFCTVAHVRRPLLAQRGWLAAPAGGGGCARAAGGGAAAAALRTVAAVRCAAR